MHSISVRKLENVSHDKQALAKCLGHPLCMYKDTSDLVVVGSERLESFT